MISEHDRVVLTTDLPQHGLKSGDIGIVVHIFGEMEGFEVEFITLDGETKAVVELAAENVRSIQHGEIPHARIPATA